MQNKKVKKFTIEEANRLLPKIIALTKRTVRQLEEERIKRETEAMILGKDADASFHQNANGLLDAWATQIMELGVMPKGFFTCDFVTPNPDRFFCWNYGEEKISFTHKVTESFKNRVPIENPELQGFEVSLN